MNCHEQYGYRNTRQYLGFISVTTGLPEGALVRLALNQGGPTRDSNALRGLPYQKNWMPFVAPEDGALHLEYLAEPRAVLRVDAAEGAGGGGGGEEAEAWRMPAERSATTTGASHPEDPGLTPVRPITSHPDLFLQQQRWGTSIRGSAPAVLLQRDRLELRGLGLLMASQLQLQLSKDQTRGPNHQGYSASRLNKLSRDHTCRGMRRATLLSARRLAVTRGGASLRVTSAAGLPAARRAPAAPRSLPRPGPCAPTLLFVLVRGVPS